MAVYSPKETMHRPGPSLGVVAIILENSRWNFPILFGVSKKYWYCNNRVFFGLNLTSKQKEASTPHQPKLH
jgi:hypothetical protein